MNLTYLIGVPGAGKTTLLDAVTVGMERLVRKPKGEMPYTMYLRDGDEVATEMGFARSEYGGTDALAMNIQPKAVAWLQGGVHAEVFGEGDRLANLKFLHAAEDAGYFVTLVLLDVPMVVAAERRLQRGSNQDPTWLKGRVTKVHNLFANWPGPCTVIDGDIPLGLQAEKLRMLPVFSQFRRGRGVV